MTPEATSLKSRALRTDSHPVAPPPGAGEFKQWAELLANMGAIPGGSLPAFLPMRRNLDRRDSLDLVPYLVRHDQRTCCHLTVGRNLNELFERNQVFATAYPDIAARPIGVCICGEFQLFAREYVEGRPLRDLLLDNATAQKQGIVALRQLRDKFTSAIVPSTTGAMLAEFDQLGAEVLQLPFLSQADRIFLAEVVLAAIRRELADVPPGIRVSHGDFIAQNIVISPTGQPRLVDCEFSSRTHFHLTDWDRFIRFSELSAPLQRMLQAELPDSPSWMKAIFWLSQLVKESETSKEEVFLRTLPKRLREILTLVQHDPRRFGRSHILDAIPSAPAATQTRPQSGAFAQLFWAASHNGYNEPDSARIQFTGSSRTHRLVFDLSDIPTANPLCLRFDPVALPAIVEIETVVVSDKTTKNEILRIDRAPSAGLFSVGGTAVAVHTEQALGLFSYGNDPRIFLPALPAPRESTSLEVTVTLQVEFSLNRLADLLNTIAQALPDQSTPLQHWGTLIPLLLRPMPETLGELLAAMRKDQAQAQARQEKSEEYARGLGAKLAETEGHRAKLEKTLALLQATESTLRHEFNALASGVGTTKKLANQLEGGKADGEVPTPTSPLSPRALLDSIDLQLRRLAAARENERRQSQASQAEQVLLKSQLTQAQGEVLEFRHKVVELRGREATLTVQVEHLEETLAREKAHQADRLSEKRAHEEALLAGHRAELSQIRTVQEKLAGDLAQRETAVALLSQTCDQLNEKIGALARCTDRAEQNEARLLGEVAYLTTDLELVAEEARHWMNEPAAPNTAADLAARLRLIEEIRSRLRLVAQARNEATQKQQQSAKETAALRQTCESLENSLQAANGELVAARERLAKLEQGFLGYLVRKVRGLDAP